MTYKTGDKINPFNIKVDKYRPIYYAGASGDFNPIHIDDEFAKSAGLPGIILQGLCTMAFVSRAVLQDKDPALLKSLKVRFRHPVRPKDALTVMGIVSKIENQLVTIDLTSENQNKEQVITNGCAVMSA